MAQPITTNSSQTPAIASLPPIKLSPPLPLPPPRNSLKKANTSSSPSPNSDTHTLPMGPPIKSIPKEKLKINPDPLTFVLLHEDSEERTVRLKRFTYQHTESKENKASEKINELSRWIKTYGESSINPNPYFELVSLLEKKNPGDKTIVHILNKVIVNPYIKTRYKINAYMKKADFYVTNPEYEDLDRPLRLWEITKKHLAKLKDPADQMQVKIYLKNIRIAKSKWKNQMKVLVNLRSYVKNL